MKEPITGQDAKDHLLVASNMTGVSTSQLDADEKTAWIFAFGVLLVVATMGNSLVTWFIIGMKLYGFNNKFNNEKINLLNNTNFKKLDDDWPKLIVASC